MSKLNKTLPRRRGVVTRTFEGAPATKIQNPALKLRRLVMANMLWEDQFYIDGESTADLIQDLIPQVSPEEVAAIAITAREKGKLRHVPLLLVRALAREPKRGVPGLVSSTLARVIQRPDEIAEFLSLYWKGGKQPLSAQVKKGLAAAFGKFTEYSLAKYDQDGAIKLRDAMFLTHPNPRKHDKGVFRNSKTGEIPRVGIRQLEALYKKIAERALTTPDTWEVALSAGGDKKETWTRLLQEKKLGALALLRNLRNMSEAGVAKREIEQALLEMKTERVLPFRFIAAANHAPQFQPQLELAMLSALDGLPRMEGKTVLLVDVSGSMTGKVSGKSDLNRMDAAAALAMLLREIAEEVEIVTFSNSNVSLKGHWRGFALRDQIINSQAHSSTDVGDAVRLANTRGADRIIVLTDEQSATVVPSPKARFAYMINVAAYQNGVGSANSWDKVDGFSEAVVDYIMALESEGLNGELK